MTPSIMLTMFGNKLIYELREQLKEIFARDNPEVLKESFYTEIIEDEDLNLLDNDESFDLEIRNIQNQEELDAWMIANGYDKLEESKTLDKIDCKSYRLNEWENDKVKILFITGYAGSGKSILGKKIAKENNVKFIELDEVWYDLRKKYNRYPTSKEIVKEAVKRSKNKKCVIEGIYILFIDDLNDITDKYAMILMNTNPTQSTLRAIQRDLTESDLFDGAVGITDYLDRIKFILNDIICNYPTLNYIIHDTIKYKLENKTYEIAKESNTLPKIEFKRVADLNNAITNINSKPYRVRIETLVTNDKGELFIKLEDKPNQYGNAYKIPGGSLEPGMTFDEVASMECEEEAGFKIKNALNTGKTYISDYNGKYPKWQIEKLHPNGLKYEGSITYVFTADFDKKYTKNINKNDTMVGTGKFIPINEIKSSLSNIHRDILNNKRYIYAPFSDVYEVFESLTDVEKTWLLSPNETEFIESPVCFYRKVEYSNKKPIGFIEVYKIQDEMVMCVAVNPKYRRKGVLTRLVKGCITLFQNSSDPIDMVWLAKEDNKLSNDIAKGFGFKFDENDYGSNVYKLKVGKKIGRNLADKTN